MKLAKRKVMPFQAIKLICASESEAQTLKATLQYLNTRKTVTERFFQCRAREVRFFCLQNHHHL